MHRLTAARLQSQRCSGRRASVSSTQPGEREYIPSVAPKPRLGKNVTGQSRGRSRTFWSLLAVNWIGAF